MPTLPWLVFGLPRSVVRRMIISAGHDLCFLAVVIAYCLAYFLFAFHLVKWSLLIPTWCFKVYAALVLVNVIHVIYAGAAGLPFKEILELAGIKADFFLLPILCVLVILVVLPLVSVPMCVYLAGAIVWKIVVKTPGFTIGPFHNSRVYSASNLGPEQIRLLRILPGNPLERVRCQLVNEYLETAQYEALSYTWGSSIPRHQILVDDLPFYVAKTLYTALLHLRHPQDTRIIWIDAICIDQSNTAERETQVRFMDRIYCTASVVVIWLGEPRDKNIGLGIEYVVRLARAGKSEVNEMWLESTKWQKAVNKMLQDSWWDRAWVVQEAFLARRPIVLCGQYQLPFDDLCSFIINPAITGRFSGLKSFAVFNLATTVLGNRNAVRDPEYSMLTLAHRFRHRIATDSRDKIYAFLGLLPDEKDHLVQINYTKTDEEVFQLFAKAVINQSRSLLVVAIAAETLSNASWCPTWGLSLSIGHSQFFNFGQYWPDYFNSQAYEETSPFWRGALDDPRWYPLQVPGKYLAAGGHPAMCRTDFDDLGMISANGFTYDTVFAVGSDPPLQIFTTWRTLLRSWELLAFQSSPAPEQERLPAFNRTITANIPDPPATNWREWAPLTRRRWKWRKATLREPEEPTFQDIMKAACTNRRFFVSSNGTFGLGPATTRVGDPICILLGSDVPFILEEVKDSDLSSSRRDIISPDISRFHKIRGQAYVDGAMVYKGDIKQDIADGKIKLREFLLI